jgi:hypothetical protein
MKYLRKRITCVNRNNSEKNETAIAKIKQRCIEKMALKGWSHDVDKEDYCSGDCMLKYEAFFTIFKNAK